MFLCVVLLNTIFLIQWSSFKCLGLASNYQASSAERVGGEKEDGFEFKKFRELIMNSIDYIGKNKFLIRLIYLLTALLSHFQGAMTLGVLTFSVTTFSITAFSITILRIMAFTTTNLSIVMLSHNTVCHYTECHYTECHYTECHFTECHYTECHYTKCHYTECHFTECHYTVCHYAECHYGECRGAIVSTSFTLIRGQFYR